MEIVALALCCIGLALLGELLEWLLTRGPPTTPGNLRAENLKPCRVRGATEAVMTRTTTCQANVHAVKDLANLKNPKLGTCSNRFARNGLKT